MDAHCFAQLIPLLIAGQGIIRWLLTLRGR
jgi:hypothetical protein